jgi:peptidylprolyl isomerase
MRRLPRFLAALFVLALFAGCAKDPARLDPLDGDGSPTVVSPFGPEAPPVSPASGRPIVTVPEGDPPTELVIEDLTVGTGPEIQAGQTAIVHYVGVFFSTGEEFDSSWDRGQPFPVENLGNAQVIDGWNQGIIGMQVGGRRQLIIPPDLAYGEEGHPAGIGPNETLIFVIDLLQIA